MIKLTNLNKYFNKGKSNEIHVINNTSLQFPNKGLISLLGSSGSGKTTLLNVIGGLDKTEGEIKFKDQVISSYNSNVWDKIRVNNIGYIFQNYYLLEDKRVYENIEIVLTMMGITNKEEVKYRVEYVLDKVGMLRFKNRLASDLSGGQKQRVAIARAIVKNPDVIIADEPTGNLDTNNSIEVLKIIKEISKEKLVLLVTHNKDLAHNYSDRIITLADGKVVSDESEGFKSNELKYIDNNLYLKDLNHLNDKNINIYSDTNIADLQFTIVKINNNYYLKTADNNVIVKVLNDNSEIKLIDDKSENFKEKLTTETDFDLKDLEAFNKPRTKSQIYTLKDSLREAFRRLANLGKKGKVQIFALIYLGISFVSALFMFTTALFIDTSNINYEKDVYLKQYYDLLPVDSLPDDAVVFIDVNVQLRKGNFKQTLFGVNVAPKEIINKEHTSPDMVYIDETVLDSKYEYSYLFNAFGINKKEHLINQKIAISNRYSFISGNDVYDLTIVDTVKTNTKTIYIDSKILQLLVLQDQHNASFITEGMELITDDVNSYNVDGIVGIYIPISRKGDEEEYFAYFNNKDKFKVLGYHTNEDNYIFYLDEQNFKTLIMIDRHYDFLFYSKAENLNSAFLNVYQSRIDDLISTKKVFLASSLVQALIVLGVSLLLFYFLVRSSLTNRRKEISILRSLGISKKEVRKAFAIEYIVITTFSSLIGVLIGNLLIYKLSGSFLDSLISITFSPLVSLISIALVYVLNVFISLIPVNSILKKAPSQLLTSYDI